MSSIFLRDDWKKAIKDRNIQDLMASDFPMAIASGRVQFLGAVIERMNEIGWNDFQFQPLEQSVIKALSGKKPAWTEHKWVTMLERMTQGGKHLLFPESSKLVQAWVVHCPQAVQRINDYAAIHNREGLWSAVAREFVYQPHPEVAAVFGGLDDQKKDTMTRYLAETLVDVDQAIRFFHEPHNGGKISPEFSQCVPQYKHHALQRLQMVLKGQGQAQDFSTLLGALFSGGGMGAFFDVDPSFKSKMDSIFEQEQRQNMRRVDRILAEHMELFDIHDIRQLMHLAEKNPYHDELKLSWPVMRAAIDNQAMHQAIDDSGINTAQRNKKKI